MATTTMAVDAAQAQANNVVYPLPRPTDGTEAWRLELDEFLGNNARTNLFLLALSQMQSESIMVAKTKSPNWWSFYSLAGIHSQPVESWNSVDHQRSYGYCHHSMNTFPTWHRVYMFQFEQAVYNAMIQMANKYTGDYKKTYLEAAAGFRLPYWDLAMPRHKDDAKATQKAKDAVAWFWGLPDILKTPQVYVRYPATPDQLLPMENPLYRFKFPSDSEFGNPLKRPKIQFGTTFNPHHTVRGPTRTDKGESDYVFLEESVQLQTRDLTTYMWQLLTPNDINKARTWDAFANRNWDGFAGNANPSPKPKEWDDKRVRSLESWHDSIHILIGTGQGFSGHMGSPSVAAFDPIFWLHHNNIERLLALFQALYPNSYVSPDNVELYPFIKDSSSKSYFDSGHVKDWKKDGFAMPGDTDKAGLQTAVSDYLRDTYYWATTKGSKPPASLKFPKDLSNVEALTGKPALTNAKTQVSFRAVASVNGQAAFVSRMVPLSLSVESTDQKIEPAATLKELKQCEHVLPDGALIDADKPTDTKMNTWNAYFRIKKYAYDQSFSIHFFIGDIESATPEKFFVRMNEAGFSGIFASSAATNCDQCDANRAAGLVYEDVVPLTNTIQDYLEGNPRSEGLIRTGDQHTIRNMSPEEVAPFLKTHLQWRIIDTSGQILPYTADSALEVLVAGRMFIPPQEGNLLGAYGPARVYGNITAGKEGGYGGVDFDMS